MAETPPSESEATTPEGLDPKEAAARLSAFEARIQAGDFDHGGFHLAVQSELYPLLGDGLLEPSAFDRLVHLWASRNHPFDWPTRTFGDALTN
jgi:hypothetical protein